MKFIFDILIAVLRMFSRAIFNYYTPSWVKQTLSFSRDTILVLFKFSQKCLQRLELRWRKKGFFRVFIFYYLFFIILLFLKFYIDVDHQMIYYDSKIVILQQFWSLIRELEADEDVEKYRKTMWMIITSVFGSSYLFLYFSTGDPSLIPSLYSFSEILMDQACDDSLFSADLETPFHFNPNSTWKYFRSEYSLPELVKQWDRIIASTNETNSEWLPKTNTEIQTKDVVYHNRNLKK